MPHAATLAPTRKCHSVLAHIESRRDLRLTCPYSITFQKGLHSRPASLLAEVWQHPGCREAGSHKRQDETQTVSQDLILALLHCCLQGVGLPAESLPGFSTAEEVFVYPLMSLVGAADEHI